MNNHNFHFDEDEMSSKQIGKHVKRYQRHQQEQKKDARFGFAVMAGLSLVVGYMIPLIAPYCLLAGAIFAVISWLLSR